MDWCDPEHTGAPMHWRQFVMDLESLSPERVEDILMRHGAVSISLSDGSDNPVLEPLPGETPLWSKTRISGLFRAGADLDRLRDDLEHAFGVENVPRYRVDFLGNRAWEREWMKDFPAMRFGQRLWICPGDTRATAPDAVTVEIDPGLAFGTGTHPTTALCLEWLDRQLLTGSTVFDVGCGSGVLAIAALKLGARRAYAVDIDPQAITATRTNAARNSVASRLAVSMHDPEPASRYDIIIANILAEPLKRLAASLAAHLDTQGLLALSGILDTQVEPVTEAYRAWIDFGEPAYRHDGNQVWALLTGRRRAS